MNELNHLGLVSLLGVVPVFVNTGAALLPAILAGLASVLGLLFQPRDLFRLCMRRPWVPVLVIAVSLGGYFLVSWLISFASVSAKTALNGNSHARRTTVSKSDWSAVALEVIRQEERDWREAWLEERDRRVALEKRVAQLKKRLESETDPSTDPDDVSQTDLSADGEHLVTGQELEVR